MLEQGWETTTYKASIKNEVTKRYDIMSEETNTSDKPAPKRPTTKAKPAPKKSSKTTAKAATTKKPAAKSANSGNKKASAAKPQAKAEPAKPEEATSAENQTNPDNNKSAGSPHASAQTEEKPENQSEQEKLVEAFKGKDWGTIITRAFWMLLFGFMGWIAIVAGFSLSVVQLVVSIVTNEPNETIGKLIAGIGEFLRQVFSFLSFETEKQPFPFGADNPFEDI